MAALSFCKDRLENALHTLHGTASHYKMLIFIEFPKPWQKNFMDDLAQRLQSSKIKDHPQIKNKNINIIGFSDSKSDPKIDKLRIYITKINNFNNKIYHTVIKRNELLQSLQNFINPNFEFLNFEEIVNKNIYFICTHSRRDRCCGAFGSKLFNLTQKSDFKTNSNDLFFSSTHLGGHRFAPLVLELKGLHYWGRVDEKALISIIDKQHTVKLWENHFRSSGYYTSKEIQWAAFNLHKKYGWSLLLKDINEKKENDITQVKISFHLEKNEKSRTVTSTIQQTGTRKVQASCDSDKLSSVAEYKVLSFIEKS